MNKKIVLAIFTFIMFASFLTVTTAIPKLLIDVVPIDNEINYNEVAEFNIELTNNQDKADTVMIPAPRNKWDITIKPYSVNLKPHESKNISVRMAPPPETNSGVYSLYFKFLIGNSSEEYYTWINVEVLESSPVVELKISIIEDVEIQEKLSEGFLTKEYSVNIINKGNVEAVDTWETTVSTLDSFLLKSLPEYVSMVDSGEDKVITWEYTLAEGESQEFKYTVSYVPMVLAFVLLIIALMMLGFYYMSRYRLIKSVVLSKQGDDSYVKIKLSVKNKTNQPQKNIIVEDYVNVPFGLSREFGTIKPDAIRKQKDRLVLTWKFDELEPREERLISYKMKAKLEVIGKVTIPPAHLKQKLGKGKQVEIYSKIDQQSKI